MSQVSDRLKALLANKGIMTGAEWQRQAEERSERRTAGEFEIDRLVPGEVVTNERGNFYLVKQEFPLDILQGHVPLGRALDSIPEYIAISAADAELAAFDPRTTLFMDTETTGLAGGTGTVAFLVGAGYFEGDVFRLEQCFMRDYDEEEAMLQYLDRLFARSETVVSYNGKSFDVPLLRTRFITNRARFRLDSAMHFDLVHAARRFYKLRLRDCSLGNVERTVLGVERHGDIPSAEIPQIWLDYLYSRDAGLLKKVFYHHQMDILSLVALAGWLSQCLETPEGLGFEHDEDRLSLVRLHFREKRFPEVVSHGERLLESETQDYIREECLRLMGLALKRLKDWPRMADTWRLLLDEHPRAIQPRFELAKYLEHRAREFGAAERLCVETLELLETRASLGRALDFDEGYAQDFRHRLERIRGKMARHGFVNDKQDSGAAE